MILNFLVFLLSNISLYAAAARTGSQPREGSLSLVHAPLSWLVNATMQAVSSAHAHAPTRSPLVEANLEAHGVQRSGSS